MSLRFEWDDDKSMLNLKKHGVSFSSAAAVFADPLSETLHDSGHSADEDRFLTVGMSSTGDVLVVSHTDRHGLIRLISARKATRYERTYYEEK